MARVETETGSEMNVPISDIPEEAFLSPSKYHLVFTFFKPQGEAEYPALSVEEIGPLEKA